MLLFVFLAVAQISLLVQNIAVAVSALLLLLILSVHVSKGLFFVLVSLVIIIACLSVLAGIATKISIEKDWIVVISGADKAILAGWHFTCIAPACKQTLYIFV